MSNGLIGIGLSGLAAAQAGLNTTSENISNVNTPGYSREEVIQQSSDPIFTGAGFIGSGTQVATIKRAYNQYQQQELVQAQAGNNQLSTYSTQISQIDNLLGSGSGGLSSMMSDFFNATQTVADNPSDIPSRQSMIASAQTLVAGFNSAGTQLASIGSDNDTQIQQSVTTINSDAQQIAALNEQIVAATGGGSGQPPNTLLDQRDALIQTLNQDVGATTITESNGAIDVFVGNGEPIVSGTQANSLVTVPSASDPNQLQLALQSGSSQVLIGTNQISGGNLAGLLAFRDQSLIPAQNAIGRLAINFSAAMNAQNSLGQDLNGNLGQDLFSAGTPQVTAATSNTGSATLSATISDPGALTTDNYRLQMQGGQYVLTDLSDNSKQTFATLPQTVDGLTLSATAGMANGDSFTIYPTVNGATDLSMATTDPTAIAAASPVRATTGTANVGTAAVASLTVVGPPPTNANLQEGIALNFHVSGGTTTYDVVDTATDTVLAAAQPYSGGAINYNGWSLSLTGAPADGDTISVSSNTNGTSDNTNALALANVQNATLIGSASLSGAYQELVGEVGSQAAQLKATSTAQGNLLSQAQQTVDSTSGVNLDDEAANLLKYQQAYQAASQTIATANTLFQSIINLFN